MPVKDPQENLDMDLVAEQELSRLQRQVVNENYQILEEATWFIFSIVL